MREIVFDTETTGLDPRSGHRVVEIGCVELVGHLPTGRHLHLYINPQRDMPAEAYAVHGLSAAFLSAHPVFADIADEFLDFCGDARMVAHNAAFDVNFLNHELDRAGRPTLSHDRITDTLALARRRHPGSPASLDALCRRFAIDLSGRGKHGALLDSQLLAAVYLQLIGGHQPAFNLGVLHVETSVIAGPVAAFAANLRLDAPSAAEVAAHDAFVAGLGGGALWQLYAPDMPGESAPRPRSAAA